MPEPVPCARRQLDSAAELRLVPQHDLEFGLVEGPYPGLICIAIQHDSFLTLYVHHVVGSR